MTAQKELLSYEIDTLSPEDKALFNKIQFIFLLGQLLELPTLNCILEQYGIKSNNFQINYQKLHKKMSYGTFLGIFSKHFESVVKEKLSSMAEKDDSIWSKVSVTAVLDDSIFRQWLADLLDKDDYYGRYFSGQFQKTVYGFKSDRRCGRLFWTEYSWCILPDVL